MKTRLFALLLACIIAVGLLPVTAMAEEQTDAVEWGKWIAFGTSITEDNIYHRDPSAEALGTYIPYLSELMGKDAPDGNYSVGGAGYATHILMHIFNTQNQTKGRTYNGFTHAAYADADLITVEGSINDFASAVPLGEVGDTAPYSKAAPITENVNSTNNFGGTTEGTFAGNIYTAITKLREVAPNATIVLITDNAGTGNCASTRKNSLGYTPHDYSNMVIAVAEYLGCHVIDAGRTAGFEENLDTYLHDHIHQSEAGGEAYANAIWAELSQITTKGTTPNPDAAWEPAIKEEEPEPEPEPEPVVEKDNYYWDFTNGAASVTDEIYWTENALTLATVPGSTATYYNMTTPVTLNKTDDWTIEWKGKLTSGGHATLLSNKKDSTAVTESIWIYNGGKICLFQSAGYTSNDDNRQREWDASAYNSQVMTWYLTNTEETLTLIGVDSDGAVQFRESKSNSKFTCADGYTFSSVKGYYATNNVSPYTAQLDYVKIYHEAVDFGAAGDVNCDGSVTDVDTIILARYLAGWSGYEDRILSMSAADVNGDDDVTDVDSIILARYLAGWGETYEQYF